METPTCAETSHAKTNQKRPFPCLFSPFTHRLFCSQTFWFKHKNVLWGKALQSNECHHPLEKKRKEINIILCRNLACDSQPRMNVFCLFLPVLAYLCLNSSEGHSHNGLAYQPPW